MKIKKAAMLATLALVLAMLLTACMGQLYQEPGQVTIQPIPEDMPPASRSIERQGLLCATEAGNCVEAWNGSGIYVYSDAGSTEEFSVAGSTGNTAIDGTLDVAGTLQYGANNLYPVGYASSGQQAVYGTSNVTGTLSVPHGLTTVTFCLATMGEDPTAGAGDGAYVTVAVAGNACTVKVWQDDFVTAATETNVAVHWLVIGAP